MKHSKIIFIALIVILVFNALIFALYYINIIAIKNHSWLLIITNILKVKHIICADWKERTIIQPLVLSTQP